MPIGTTEDVAQRVERERLRRGLSYRALAEAMAEHGCPIQPSALQRLECGYSGSDKRPKLGTDELAALCRVFEISPDDMLTPIEMVGQVHALRLLDTLSTATRDIWILGQALWEAVCDLRNLTETESGREVAEYVRNMLGDLRPPSEVDPVVASVLRPALFALMRRGLIEGTES